MPIATIYVDTREKSSVPDYLDEYDLKTERKALLVGDYIIGDICVEYKTIQDYCNSLMSGHLHKQLYQMSYNFPLSYLCITGLYGYELTSRKIQKATYISSIAGSSYKRANDGAMGQIITVQFEHEQDSALFLKFLYNKVSNGQDIRLPVMERHRYSKADWQLNMLCGLPNIGPKLGKVLLKNFKSIKEISNAKETELVTIPGISKVKAQEIYDYFNKQYASNWSDVE